MKCPHCNKIIYNKSQLEIISILKTENNLTISEIHKRLNKLSYKNVNTNVWKLANLGILGLMRNSKYNCLEVTLK